MTHAFPSDDAALVRALEAANLPALLMVMIHLSGCRIASVSPSRLID